jgi:hypothetical protein
MTLNPFDQADLYDYPTMAGEPCPLLCDVADGGSPREWEVKKAHGNSGASVVYNGDGLAEVPMRVFAWTREHFLLWAPWRAAHIAKPIDGSKPKAQDFRHPFLEELGIVSVVIKDEKIWKKAAPDLWVKDIVLLQYREPEPAQAKPQGSTSGPSNDNATTPEDEADQLIEELSQQLDEEAAA